MKTYAPKPEHVVRRWYVVDASGQVLGRLASEVAALLRGKHKPIFAPHMDTGDHVIVVNAEKVELTGGKEMKKIAYRHSGYPGGITATRYDRLMAERPTFVIEKAIKGMLPKNRLGRAMVKKLHVVVGPEHRHQAQQPTAYTLGRPPVWAGLPVKEARTPKAVVAIAPEPVPEPEANPRRAARDTARTTTAKKTTAKKTAARTTTAKKTAAKRAAAKSTAAKSTAKRTATRRPAAKRDREES